MKKSTNTQQRNKGTKKTIIIISSSSKYWLTLHQPPGLSFVQKRQESYRGSERSVGVRPLFNYGKTFAETGAGTSLPDAKPLFDSRFGFAHGRFATFIVDGDVSYDG